MSSPSDNDQLGSFRYSNVLMILFMFILIAMVVLQYFSPEDQVIVFGIVLIPIGIFLIRKYDKDKKKVQNS